MQAAELYQSILRESDLVKRRELAQQLKSLAESGSKEALVPLSTLQLFGLNALQIDTDQADDSARAMPFMASRLCRR